MTTTRREFTEEDLMFLYLIKDNDGDFLKHNGTDDTWDREGGADGAQLFSADEAQETIEHNHNLKLTPCPCGEYVDSNIYDLIEEA